MHHKCSRHLGSYTEGHHHKSLFHECMLDILQDSYIHHLCMSENLGGKWINSGIDLGESHKEMICMLTAGFGWLILAIFAFTHTITYPSMWDAFWVSHSAIKLSLMAFFWTCRRTICENVWTKKTWEDQEQFLHLQLMTWFSACGLICNCWNMHFFSM